MKALTGRQVTALVLVRAGFVSASVEASCRSLLQRSLVEDHGRYWWRNRRHGARYSINDAGRKLLEELGR